MRTFRLTVFLGLLLAAVGCKKASADAAMPPDYGGAAEAPPMADPMPDVTVGSTVTMDDMDEGVATAEAESAPMDAPPARELRSRRMARAEKRKADKLAPAGPSATGEPAQNQATPAEPAVEEPKQDLDTRYVIYTATMTISVFNLEEAVAKAEELPEALGGYIHSMQGGQLVIRVPAKRLRQALTQLAGFGVVEHRALTAQDVSSEYVDMESRIRALESTQKQLLELMSKARTVDEALHVRQALDQVTAELEVLKGRIRQYDNLIAYSTITVTLMERGPHTPVPSSNDPFPWVDNLGVEATEWK